MARAKQWQDVESRICRTNANVDMILESSQASLARYYIMMQWCGARSTRSSQICIQKGRYLRTRDAVRIDRLRWVEHVVSKPMPVEPHVKGADAAGMQPCAYRYPARRNVNV